MKQKRGKKNIKIRYFFYCVWARELLLKEIGPPNAQYSYPKSVLDYIRMIAPGDVVDEIRDDAFKVDLDVFCETMGIPKTTV